jgi:cytochrome c oxidase cbb3-type subunit I/II
MSEESQLIKVTYNDRVVRQFTLASVVFGVVGMLVGVTIALQLAWWPANTGEPMLSFGRLRPLHTNAAIFAFVGNMLFAGVYYSTQRLVKARMASDLLSAIHFWGWQFIIVCAAITLPLGITQGKEYAELEWPIDLMVVVVWVVFAINFFWTLAKRREKHLYVALWFYISTIVTIAVLYIVNNLALPLSLTKSYSVFAGVQDALVQWWYGHNAVAFFLTTPILGIMYYFLPKAAGRPVFSYRLSIVHFWALVFVYIWAGPHHLLNTALPEWAQSLGMVFSLALWAPSWGGMLNGLLTLRGAWDKVRQDPVLKFFAAGVTFYGMATFEGPLLAIKSVSALSHYTDWVVGHVHSGTLGWNGFMAIGMFYWIIPRMWGTKLHSRAWADLHFWIGTLGILLYIGSMWMGGITQGLMWRAWTEEGLLQYPNFVETVIAINPMYWVRLIGGVLYLSGYVLMIVNLVKTIASGKAVDGSVEVVDVPEWRKTLSQTSTSGMLLSPAMVLIYIGTVGGLVMLAPGPAMYVIGIVVSIVVGILGYRAQVSGKTVGFHRILEGRPLLFTVLVLLGILVGGLVELVPAVTMKEAVPLGDRLQKPYTALELAGRDIYIREGCYTCHSQMIRPFRDETVRYGRPGVEADYSRAGEFIYDHPFQWGSKRTGPDLHREGGRRTHLWHYKHMLDPRSVTEGSIMPAYAWMEHSKSDLSLVAGRVAVMSRLGVPYKKADLLNASEAYQDQAEDLVSELNDQDESIDLAWDSELAALIAYLQILGQTETISASTKAGSK